MVISSDGCILACRVGAGIARRVITAILKDKPRCCYVDGTTTNVSQVALETSQTIGLSINNYSIELTFCQSEFSLGCISAAHHANVDHFKRNWGGFLVIAETTRVRGTGHDYSPLAGARWARFRPVPRTLSLSQSCQVARMNQTR